jgi:hypothetical protein
MRLGTMYENILPQFYLRRDKRLIAHEVSAPSRVLPTGSETGPSLPKANPVGR